MNPQTVVQQVTQDLLYELERQADAPGGAEPYVDVDEDPTNIVLDGHFDIVAVARAAVASVNKIIELMGEKPCG